MCTSGELEGHVSGRVGISHAHHPTPPSPRKQPCSLQVFFRRSLCPRSTLLPPAPVLGSGSGRDPLDASNPPDHHQPLAHLHRHQQQQEAAREGGELCSGADQSEFRFGSDLKEKEGVADATRGGNERNSLEQTVFTASEEAASASGSRIQSQSAGMEAREVAD